MLVRELFHLLSAAILSFRNVAQGPRLEYLVAIERYRLLKLFDIAWDPLHTIAGFNLAEGSQRTKQLGTIDGFCLCLSPFPVASQWQQGDISSS